MAAVEDSDSLCCRFCPDSLLDHIVAKVFAPEMDEELVIVVCVFVRGKDNNQFMFNRK